MCNRFFSLGFTLIGCIVLSDMFGYSQPPSPKSTIIPKPTPRPNVERSDRHEIAQELEDVRIQYNKVLDDAGRNFKQGLEFYKANKRADSGTSFDKAVEVFLYSSLNIQSDARLQGCYQQLIETVYRLEFPNASQPPQIRPLSATCGWSWDATDQKIADEVAQISKNSVLTTGQANAAASNTSGSAIKQPNFVGFNESTYEASPLDELSKLELTENELNYMAASPSILNAVSGESWQTISNRTGVGVAELMAANPGMKEPKGKVFMPVSGGNRITAASYSRPSNQSVASLQSNTRIVKAQAGDTVAKLASRHNVDAVEVAKYNGLLPNSVLGVGREIKIPLPQAILLTPVSIYGDRIRKLCSEAKRPVVQKLSLDLSVNEVSVRLGRKLNIKKLLSPQSQNIYYSALRGKGLRMLFLAFYRGKLYRVVAEYDSSIRWKNQSEFQNAVANGLGFPSEAFSLFGGSKFSCDDFEIDISQDYAGRYSLVLENPKTYSHIYEEWRQKVRSVEIEQNRRKKQFKP